MYDYSYIYTGDVLAFLLRSSSPHTSQPGDLGQDVSGDTRVQEVFVERETLCSQDWNKRHLHNFVGKSAVGRKVRDRLLLGRERKEGEGFGADSQGDVGVRTSDPHTLQRKRQATGRGRPNPSDSLRG